MKYCKKCVQPDTRPAIIFDEEGVCYACRYAESAKSIDWEKREKELMEIAEWAKKNNRGGYDCVIGVSGGKDSTVQALIARDKMGLNPLLVNAVPENITEIGKHNIDNLARLGFDLLMLRPNPNIMRQLIKRDFYKYGNPQKVTEYTLWASAYQIALAYEIPLVIQGENAGLTLGVKNLGRGDDAAEVFKNNTLQGGDGAKEYSDEVDPKNLIQYKFPKRELLDQAGIRAIYLQYYTKDWSPKKNAEFAVKHGLRVREEEDLHDIGRYNRYFALDSDMNIYNQMIKYYKLGFGFATDEACYDIRDGYITRSEGIRLVKEYDSGCADRYIQKFCDYIDIIWEEFWRVVDKFTNKKLFRKDLKTGKWMPKFEVGVDFYEETDDLTEERKINV